MLRHYRKVQGFTQEELAEEWNYSFETISAWEREKRFPSCSEFPRLAHLLGIEVEELAEMIGSRRAGQGSKAGGRQRQEPVSRVPEVVPFEQGRLFWTLHLGLEHGWLQCLITCPLASGETWEVPLDSLADTDNTAVWYVTKYLMKEIMRERRGLVEEEKTMLRVVSDPVEGYTNEQGNPYLFKTRSDEQGQPVMEEERQIVQRLCKAHRIRYSKHFFPMNRQATKFVDRDKIFL